LRISVRTKQVVGVTAIVFAVVAILGGYYMFRLADVLITETHTRAEMVAKGVLQRITHLVLEGGDLREKITADDGLQTMLEASMYAPNMLYTAVVHHDGTMLAYSDGAVVDVVTLPPSEELQTLVNASYLQKVRAIYSDGLTHEFRYPLVLDSGNGPQPFGSIRVGVTTLLLRDQVEEALRPALMSTGALLIAAVLVSMLLAQWMLRPILLLRAGLARLGQGDTGVTLDFAQQDEFADLGESFNVVSARLAREHADGEVSRTALSRRLAALGRVSSGIAHEVKNPLNAMRIHLELLRMKTADVPGTHDHVQVLADQMRRLDEVVGGFLTFTRSEDLVIAPVTPRDLFDEMLPVVSAEAGKTGVKVAVDIPGDVPAIAGDRALLAQALLNLAINACHAMPRGGRLTLAARRKDDTHVQLMVEDTGTGIEPEHLEKIFNLYFTTKADGSGIGLALVYRTIHLHDGDIDVQSVPGSGTTFTVTLPAA
jgi:signal transduction histidine kinase